jgi:chromosome segregation ATPase
VSPNKRSWLSPTANAGLTSKPMNAKDSWDDTTTTDTGPLPPPSTDLKTDTMAPVRKSGESAPEWFTLRMDQVVQTMDNILDPNGSLARTLKAGEDERKRLEKRMEEGFASLVQMLGNKVSEDSANWTFLKGSISAVREEVGALRGDLKRVETSLDKFEQEIRGRIHKLEGLTGAQSRMLEAFDKRLDLLEQCEKIANVRGELSTVAAELAELEGRIHALELASGKLPS